MMGPWKNRSGKSVRVAAVRRVHGARRAEQGILCGEFRRFSGRDAPQRPDCGKIVKKQ
jgi:hypothetical protein